MFHALLDLLRREPVMVKELLAATLALALSFGLTLSSDQQGAIMAFSTIVLGIVARSQVRPVSTSLPKPPDFDAGED